MQTQEFNDVVGRFNYVHQEAQLCLQEVLSHAKAPVAEGKSRRK